MISKEAYLAQTEHAMKSLFELLNEYREVINLSVPPIYVDDAGSFSEINEKYTKWRFNHEIAEAHELATYAYEEHQAHAFSQAIISGSILQIASKAIDLYGANNVLSTEASTLLNGLKDELISSVTKYASGRLIRNVPLGLVIYAGRNQYNHIEAGDDLREVNARVFKALSENHGYGDVIDPAFDLKNGQIDSYSSNIVALIDWNRYDEYYADIQEILELR